MKAVLVLRRAKRIEGEDRPVGFVLGTVELAAGVPADRLQLAIDADNVLVQEVAEAQSAEAPKPKKGAKGDE